MRKTIPSLVAALLFATAASAAFAQSTVSARPIAAAERAFSAAARATNTRDAFLKFIARNGVIFRPHAVNGKDVLEKQPVRPGLLQWEPAFADISASNDLGFSTGPFTIRRSPQDSVAGRGDYATVWRKQEDGTWKFVIDLGIGYEKEAPRRALVVKTRKATSARVDAGMVRDAVRAVDEQRTRNPATLAFDPDARVLRDGEPALTGAAALARVRGETGVVYTSLGAHASTAGDLGYTYGEYRRGNEKGNFLHLYRKAGGTWVIALDVHSRIE